MLDLKLRPSRMLVALLGVTHLLTAALVWIMPIALGIQAGISFLLAGSCVFHLRRDGWLAAQNSIHCLHFDPNCHCSFQTRNGSRFEAKLLGSSLVTPWLTVLNLKPETSPIARHAVILPDSADDETFRRLRVLLRWKCGSLARGQTGR